MADVTLNHIYKVYPNGVKAVSDFNIAIKDKEFIVFVGPSGCGKSTTLRMIAGLEDITAGDLFIGNTLVNDVQPKDRDIAMVFQNYALYPHMTVYENIAFSLRNRHMSKEEINKRVLEAAKVLGIEEYLDRKPKAMSGGQRQRVALGRAIVRNPKVFLLDEPLSNLDAKLRAQMRTEISKLHKKLATTFIYVTHDQVEAMTMGTRIVVMKLGVVQQIDTPTNLYNHPINKFVAGFIGTPQMNFFDVVLEKKGNKVAIAFEDKQLAEVDYSYFIKCDPMYLDGKTHVTLGIRPDNILIAPKAEDKKTIGLVVTSIEKLGNETLLYCDLAKAVKTDESVTKSSIIIRVAPNDTHKIGDAVDVNFRNELLQIFDNKTEKAVMPFFPTYSKVQAEFKGEKMILLGKEVKKPAAFKDVKDGLHLISIPNDSVDDGKDFALKAIKCEKIEDDKFLVTLESKKEEEYLFCNSPVAVKEGEEVNFSLAYEDLSFEEGAGVARVKHEVEAVGHFFKKKEKNPQTNKNEIHFYATIEGGEYRLSDEFVKRFFSIEGRRGMQVNYRLRFTPLISEDGKNLVKHLPEGILDYSKEQYLKVKIGEYENFVPVTSVAKKGLNDVDFTIDQNKPLEVYTLDTDVKIM
jgi:multiple sugar transport system ATP-binding protein